MSLILYIGTVFLGLLGYISINKMIKELNRLQTRVKTLENGAYNEYKRNESVAETTCHH